MQAAAIASAITHTVNKHAHTNLKMVLIVLQQQPNTAQPGHGIGADKALPQDEPALFLPSSFCSSFPKKNLPFVPSNKLVQLVNILKSNLKLQHCAFNQKKESSKVIKKKENGARPGTRGEVE